VPTAVAGQGRCRCYVLLYVYPSCCVCCVLAGGGVRVHLHPVQQGPTLLLGVPTSYPGLSWDVVYNNRLAFKMTGYGCTHVWTWLVV
jgi:hypothetical protein